MQTKNRRKPSGLTQFLIIGGVLLLVLVVLTLKDQSRPKAPTSTSALPEAQLERALSAGKPALGFFHSNNCEQCIIMIETVEQVFPEFASSVALVDVDVYDPSNDPLLNKEGVQYIPMLVFYDRSGQSQTFVGVMRTDILRQRLSSLTGAQ